jgi:hypothetical protein
MSESRLNRTAIFLSWTPWVTVSGWGCIVQPKKFSVEALGSSRASLRCSCKGKDDFVIRSGKLVFPVKNGIAEILRAKSSRVASDVYLPISGVGFQFVADHPVYFPVADLNRRTIVGEFPYPLVGLLPPVCLRVDAPCPEQGILFYRGFIDASHQKYCNT